MAGIFAQWQPRYAEAGIATFPVKEKRPAVSNYLKMGLRASQQMALKFPALDALGFACKNNNITIVDVDSPDERLLRDAIDEYGPTPIIVRSGSGNFQAWYRRNGEGRKIRPDAKRPIDILGGGFVVAPPSQGSKGPYSFISGSLDDLRTLRPMRRPAVSLTPDNDVQEPIMQPSEGSVCEGHRNDTLWRESMKAARSCTSFDELLVAARSINSANCNPPLPDSEVISCAASAWDKQQSGQNWINAGWRVDLRPDEVDGLMHENPDAFILMMKLRRHHWGRKFVAANAMHKIMPNGGWTEKRFTAARKYLEQIGELVVVRQRTRHTPTVYQFKGGQI